jgi:DNA replication protein DnaC
VVGGDGGLGLVLFGEVGRGKTAIAAAAAAARTRISPVRWISVAELLLALRMPFDAPEFAAAQRALAPRGGRAALVLDDLDKLRPTEHAVQPLYVAVNAWIEAELPLIVTMNRGLDALADDFGERFGDPIASRLAEHCEVLEIEGRERRLQP